MGSEGHAMPTHRSMTIALATAPFARSAAEARTTDPILAAIKAHQAAWELAREASDDDIDALMDAEARQLAELLRMTPTTIAGCAAMMRWIETYTRDDANNSYLFCDWDDPWSEPGSTLLGRLAGAIEKTGA